MRGSDGIIEEIFEICHNSSITEGAVILANLAIVLAKKRKVKEARDVIGGIAYAYTRAFAYARLAEVTGSPNDLERAEREVEEGSFTPEETFCLKSKIAAASRDRSRSEEIVRMAAVADPGRTDARIQRFLIATLVACNGLADARSAAFEIPEINTRATAFAEIAEVSGCAQDLDEIQKGNKHTLRMIEVLLKIGDVRRAREIAFETMVPSTHMAGWLRIALTTREIKDLEQAIKSEQRLAGSNLPPLIMCEVGTASAHVGDLQSARRIASALSQLTNYPKRRWLQAKVLTAIFEAMTTG